MWSPLPGPDGVEYHRIDEDSALTLCARAVDPKAPVHEWVSGLLTCVACDSRFHVGAVPPPVPATYRHPPVQVVRGGLPTLGRRK